MLTRFKTLFARPAVDLASAARPLFDEVAPIAGGADITRGIVDGLPLLASQDPLAGRDGGLPLDTYVAALTDHQVFSALQQRRLAVVSTEWEVLPGGTRLADQKAAELIRALLAALPWDQITAKMHHGIYFGQGVAECLWMRDGASVVPEAIRVRDPRRFGYRPDGAQVLLTATNPLGDALPARKFWTFRTGAFHDDEPYGMGIGHWIYWPVQFKRGVAKLWLINLDKYASPTAAGHFPPTAGEDEKAKLLAALTAIRSQAAIIMPEGYDAELLSAGRSGAADYREAAGYWDAAISKVILGHSAGADSTPGRLGGEDNAGEVRADLVKADADVLCASANLSWVKWVTEWSIPGAVPPTIWRRTEEDEDLGQRAERDAKLFVLGYRPTLDQIVATYGGDWEAVGAGTDGAAGDAGATIPPEALNAYAMGIDRLAALLPIPQQYIRDVVGIPAPRGGEAVLVAAPKESLESARDIKDGNDQIRGAPTTDLAAPADPPDPIARQLERLAFEAASLVDAGLLAVIRRELDAAPDLATFNARLLTLYPELNGADLTELLGQAFLAGELAGRVEADA
ncbi:DUF935 domain-containing protein [Thiocystis violascens]|uniref:Mu-like prophage protein gp29 n=1 Tax=Thiocystis violascens (strain ATCC 17096 / DSM 198 / 6111) TaxID=765911 RepID=I3YEG9_THIV6|nr:DUF935 family protein [Thiocystis violascens]AFL75387.1 Mu-like prophage protein gp29 [Thiocystis violascens DSM 198]